MTFKVACLGAGYFSALQRESWARMDDVSIVGVGDLDLAKAEATGYPAFDNVTDLLALSPDIFDIAVPPAGHAAAVRAGLAASVPTIICQKPFCTSLEEAEAVVAEAKGAGITLVVHENFRFQPWYRHLKAALDEGVIGEVLQMTFRLRPGDGQGPEAYLDRQPYFQSMPKFLVRETAVHWIDTFRYLFGDPSAVWADLRQINPVIAGEDAGVIASEHPGGVRCLFDGNRHLDHASDNPRRTMGEALVEGTKGTIRLHGDGSLTLRGFGQIEETELLAADRYDGFGGDCVHNTQSHVIAALKGEGALENAAEDYLTVLRIEDAVYRSAKEGRRVAL